MGGVMLLTARDDKKVKIKNKILISGLLKLFSGKIVKKKVGLEAWYQYSYNECIHIIMISFNYSVESLIMFPSITILSLYL